MTRYHLILLFAFVAVWIWAAINPLLRDGWLLENYLVFIFVPIILISGYYFRLSNVSYTLITIFMILHVVGSHYTYAQVPFGYTLQQWFGESRNMYDRLVHFSFGFLLAYPIREVFVRITRVKGFWGYYLPFDVVLSFSGAYEIIEWFTAQRVDPASGLAFLGTQGDLWDTQKDMTVAAIGAVIAMLTIAAINWWYNPHFRQEIRSSFRIPRGDAPLGEVRLRELIEERNNTS